MTAMDRLSLASSVRLNWDGIAVKWMRPGETVVTGRAWTRAVSEVAGKGSHAQVIPVST